MSIHIKSKKTLAVVLIILIGIVLKFFSLADIYSSKFHDTIYQKNKPIDDRILIIGIDEESYSKYGRFSGWSRSLHVELIDFLRDAGASVIAFDITFEDLDKSDPESDKELVKAAKQAGNVIIPYSIDLSSNKVIGPFEELDEEVKKGHIFTFPDSDGVVRSTAVTYKHSDNKVYKSFAWKIYETYMNKKGKSVDISDLPLYAQRNLKKMYIDYSGENKDYPIISYASYMNYDKDFYKDKIVLIGPFVVAIEDSYPTSLNKSVQTYGVVIHANIVQQMLEENYKSILNDNTDLLVTILMIIILSILSYFITQKTTLLKNFIFHIGLIILAIIITRILYHVGIVFDVLYLLIQVSLVYIVFTIWNYVDEITEKKRIRNIFGKYVAPQVVNKILSEGERGLKLGGTRREISVLFVDIRGFTSLSEKISPEEVVVILNEYLNLTAKSILDQGGMLDKFIGDATMALFNAPLDLENHPLKAIKAAWAMKAGSEELKKKLLEKCGRSVDFGIGINTGFAVVGNIGADTMMNYTAIGDVVNIAARLEGQSKPGQIIISEETYRHVQNEVEVNKIGKVKVKGKEEELLVYEVIALK